MRRAVSPWRPAASAARSPETSPRPLFGAASQLVAEAAPLLVAGLDEPAARRGDVADALGDVGLQAHVGERQPHGGGDRSRERLVAQRSRVVHERGHRRAAVLARP